MAPEETARAIADRFRQKSAPTLIANVSAKNPIALSYVSSPVPLGEKTKELEPEDAFAVHVHLAPLISTETWINGRHADVPVIATAGVCIFDLRAPAVALVRGPMEFVRIHLAQNTLDDLAYERGAGFIGGLKMPQLGTIDRTLYGLAQALVHSSEAFGRADPLFIDFIALAFHAHIARVYGQAHEGRDFRGGLAPWQLRRARELMLARLEDGISIAELAAECRVSPSYFARAFRKTAGAPPHRWLMNERVKRAKVLLRTDGISLINIAAACGFANQSHLTRVFSRKEGQSPARWRRSVGL